MLVRVAHHHPPASCCCCWTDEGRGMMMMPGDRETIKTRPNRGGSAHPTGQNQQKSKKKTAESPPGEGSLHWEDDAGSGWWSLAPLEPMVGGCSLFVQLPLRGAAAVRLIWRARSKIRIEQTAGASSPHPAVAPFPIRCFPGTRASARSPTDCSIHRGTIRSRRKWMVLLLPVRTRPK